MTEARETVGRVWLALPNTNKNDLESLGAHYDPVTKAWYTKTPSAPGFEIWAISPSHTFENEDRSFGNTRHLYIDLIPATTWTKNVRSALTGATWARVSRICRARADMRCEICHASLNRSLHPWSDDHTQTFRLDCHERWSFDIQTKEQCLERLMTLCYECHAATHMGRSHSIGIGPQAISHYMRISGISEQQMGQEMSSAIEVWRERSTHRWNLDLTFMSS